MLAFVYLDFKRGAQGTMLEWRAHPETRVTFIIPVEPVKPVNCVMRIGTFTTLRLSFFMILLNRG